jgi:hypothetical protein
LRDVYEANHCFILLPGRTFHMAPLDLEKLEFGDKLFIDVLHRRQILDNDIQFLLIHLVIHLRDVFCDQLFLKREHF